MRGIAWVLGIAAVGAPAGLAAQAPVPELEGAWRVTQLVTTGPAARTLDSPQPGLLLFTGRHYSYTLVTGDEPRSELRRGVPTADDLLRIWSPFSANAGTFEVSGDTMTRWPLVAKNSDTMAPGAFNRYTFRVAADTLWMTTVGTEAGPARNPSTVRYVRVR